MLFERAHLEAQEAQNLAPYAVKSGQSRGRQHLEAESRFRTPFQKDRDRVNHTTAFRRLQYKTQVFVNYEGDYYRTRLTHTLEVAQVARSIVRALGLNQELAETIAFAHDLGHPPFGHSGEAVLDNLMQGHGGFDHNKQSMRIVTYLEQRYPGFRGLNLCWETREGIVKHETRYDLPDAEGYEPHLRPSLEAQIVNLADEIAYNAHDLDDGLRAGLLVAGQLWEVELLRDLLGGLGLRPDNFDEMGRRIFIRELLGLIITDTITATHQLLEKHRIGSLEAVRSHPAPLAVYSGSLTRQLNELREFLYASLYRHYYVVRQVGKSRLVLEKLFEAYTRDPQILPPQVQKAAEAAGIHRAACDYIAGMTDRFALDEYARLFEPEFHR
ncbi:deoxyguanosinetriphosphate triphosphohydrolase [uncultured Meiothermus sp.]|uniref:deoxyguanosinetriphosphate triphosphohydrolase n=1 Tax=uncultured Meiothermus sp. TaxID=157471 RepID=UPI0026252DC9|nr:deoxyguanosinetriphosphate triphosphohydrolase [uncultured Meiothermus sp.]